MAAINKNEVILNHLVFVDQVEYNQRGLLIQYQPKKTRIEFYTNGYVLTRPAEIYQAIMKQMAEPLFINIQGFEVPKKLKKVYQNNPMLSFHEQYSQRNRDYVDDFISLFALELEEEQILAQIEMCLQKDNNAEFQQLSQQFHNLQLSKQVFQNEL